MTHQSPHEPEHLDPTSSDAAPEPDKDFRAHAEMLARLAADFPGTGLLVLRALYADPDSGHLQHMAMQLEDSDIVDGVKHIRTRSRKVANQIVNAAEEIAERAPFHLLTAPLAIMDSKLTAGRPGLEADVFGCSVWWRSLTG